MNDKPFWYTLDVTEQPVGVAREDIQYLKRLNNDDIWPQIKDQINDYFVSTVFLGVDHSFGDGPPILWETMVFKNGEEIYCNRYSSAKEARQGHQTAVLWVLNGGTPIE